MYFASAVSIRTSLILLYYRIFGVIRWLRWFRWLLAAVWSVVLLFFVGCVLIAVLGCSPMAFYWNKSIHAGSCINQNHFYRWGGVANLLIDFTIWSLTMPVVWHLSLNTRQKVSLSAIFLLGLLSVSPATTPLCATPVWLTHLTALVLLRLYELSRSTGSTSMTLHIPSFQHPSGLRSSSLLASSARVFQPRGLFSVVCYTTSSTRLSIITRPR